MERVAGERFAFVVGKGGVGKTTTAAALALAHADAGRSTHLLSIDPAHSIADVFDQPLAAGGPASCRCTELLILEEFDSDEYTRRWIEGSRHSISELVDRGTYLTGREIDDFLELSPPLDEIAASWRLTELVSASDSRPERVVVDTAPTGHLMRLLDAGAVARGWARTLEAMAEKAGAVASSFSGGEFHFEAETVIGEINSRTQHFEDDVLADAVFVLVTRPDKVTNAETDRLAAHVRGRGLRLGPCVSVGRGNGNAAGNNTADAPDEEREILPLRLAPEPPRGCEALREVGRQLCDFSFEPSTLNSSESEYPDERRSSPRVRVRRADLGDESRSAGRGTVSAFLDTVPPLLLFVGKGGVGKSTCAAACALELAESRPVTLFDADPAASAADVLGTRGDAVSPRLRIRRLDAAAAFDRFRERQRAILERFFERIGLRREMALDRRVLESLMELAPPGMDELAGLVRMLEMSDAEDAGALVIDAAPTGHLLRLIRMPERALQWVHALMRVVLEHGASGGLDEVAEQLLDLAARIRSLNARLTDRKRAAAIVVTVAEPLVVLETRRLLDALEAAGIHVAAVIRNRTRRQAGGTGETRAADKDSRATPPRGTPVFSAPFMAPAGDLEADGIEGVAGLRAFAASWERES